MSDDRIYDIDRYEFDSGKVSLDFRLNVPKTPHEDLRSSATVEPDGGVKQFELRLGLLSKDHYESEEIVMEMRAILERMDLPPIPDKYKGQGFDRTAADEIKPKLGYDPHWGELGFYQVHLKCNTFFPPEMDEDEFEEFVREYTTEFIDRFEWYEVDDE